MIGMGQRMLNRGLPRDLRASAHLTAFLVVTVATILITRGALALAGYPQVGGSGLHIAHVLWGGLLLAATMVLLLSFTGPLVRPIAVVTGGIGFGLFLDEMGKFVTSTNNYFFRPAVAIIYVVVVLFVLLIHWVHGRKPPGPTELLAAAISEAAAGSAGGITDGRRTQALALVARAGDVQCAPLAATLIDALPAGTRELGDPVAYVGDRLRRFGVRVLDTKPARVVTVGLLCIASVVAVIGAGTLFVLDIFRPGTLSQNLNNIASVGGTISALASAICVFEGLRLLRHDRRAAYGWFQRAVLIDLLVSQVFTLADDQFSALPGVALDLVMLAVLSIARSAQRGPDALELTGTAAGPELDPAT
jgi:hypothetical protein